MKIENAIGRTGSVYLSFRRAALARFGCPFKALKIFDALSAGGYEIPTRSMVKVVRVQGGGTLIVEQLDV